MNRSIFAILSLFSIILFSTTDPLLADPPVQGVPFGDASDWESADVYVTGTLSYGDIDGDGFPDLAVGTYGGGYPPNAMNKVVFFNKTGKLETKPSWISEDESFTPDGSWADFNNDGMLDFLSINGGPSADKNSIYFGSQTGLSKTPGWIDQNFASSLFAAVGDVNNDGYQDFFSANQSYNPGVPGFPVLGYVSNGKMIDTKFTWRSSYAIQGMGITLGDYDMDGLEMKSTTISGDGKRKLFYLPQENIYKIFKVERNGQSIMDWAYHEKDGFFTFAMAPGNTAQTTVKVSYVTTKDLDLFVVPSRGPVLVHRNDGNGFFPGETFTVGDGTLESKLLKFIDIDNDGDLDLFVGGRLAPMAIFYNDKGKLDKEPFWYSKDDSPSMQDADFGDINGDGFPDLVTAHWTNKLGEFRVYLNAKGRLSTEPDWSMPWSAYKQSGTSIALCDVNLDGKLDMTIAVARGPVRIFLNKR